MRDRAPFRPFNVHLTNGEKLAVEHPEQMSAPEDQENLFVIWTKGDWNLIDASQVGGEYRNEKDAQLVDLRLGF